jgi:rhodanese-related sulfurtransferase
MIFGDQIPLRSRLALLAINAVFFSFSYLLCNALAERNAVTRDIAFAFETHIPFIAWMIVPYLSSGLVFGLTFFALPNQAALSVFSQRLLLATALASVVFVLYPLHFHGDRPEVQAPFFAHLFQLLAVLDRPYNQLPSLHIAFCLVAWNSLKTVPMPRWPRVVIAVWLLLTSASTLLTYQHRLLDIVAGGLLGALCTYWIKPNRAGQNVALFYMCAAVSVVLLGAWSSQPYVPWFALYISASLLLVGWAYWRSNTVFLHKQQGRIPFLAWLKYGPYLLGYRITWLLVIWRERKNPAVRQVSEHLWMGRRLRNSEVQLLPEKLSVIDLANELSETPLLRIDHYQHFPLLDLITPSPIQIGPIVVAIREALQSNRNVYVHCAMGYERCVLVVNAYLKTQHP